MIIYYMDIKLGNLSIVPASDHPELLGVSVAAFLSTFPDADKIGVVEIDPEISGTSKFCEFYKTKMDQAANCVVIEASRTDRKWLAACLILGSTRADINGLARKTLDARKASFAQMEKAVTETGMEYGAINPLGLPKEWPILIDSAVVNSEAIIIGSGIRKSKLVLQGNILAKLTNAIVLEGLGK